MLLGAHGVPRSRCPPVGITPGSSPFCPLTGGAPLSPRDAPALAASPGGGGGAWFTRVSPQIVKPSPSEEEVPEETSAAPSAAPDTAEEAEESAEAESVPSSLSASQSGELAESGGSLSLSRSLASAAAEELAQLRPRMDLRLCPSPG